MKKVVIIGGGPAGLTAAEELLREPGAYDVTVLEETDVLGGISRTVDHNGNRMDMGGHRFFSKNARVTAWWEDHLPVQGAASADDLLLGRAKPLSPGGPDPEKQDRVMLIRQRVSRIFYGGRFFDYPLKMSAVTFRSMGIRNTFRAVMSYLYSAVRKRREDSLEDFYINRFGKVLYGMFFEGYTEKLWGRHPSGISASWGAQRVKGLSILALVRDMFGKRFRRAGSRRVETSLIEEFRYPKFGPGQLWKESGARIAAAGGRILMRHGVREICVRGERITEVVCDTPEGEKRFEGDFFLSSMPVRDLVTGISGERPPADVLAAAGGLPYRDFVTAGLLLRRLKLANRTAIRTLSDIIPDCWIYVQDTGVKLGRVQVFNNWSPYMLRDPLHTVWIGLEYFCSEGDDFWNKSDDEIVQFATEELVKAGFAEADDVLDAHCERVRKAYPAYFDTYAEMDSIREYLLGIGNLHCIGRNGQHRYNNMDHSMMTAFRAAECIRDPGIGRETVWDVNTEEEYHETKGS